MPLIIYLMHKSKILTVVLAAILGLLLSFVTIADDNSIINDGDTVNLNGTTYKARITAAKAIVYSDENMLSPLGYIANGKAIIVGNPRRINRDLVPIVIHGRLAFIELKDIRFEDKSDEDYNVKRGAPREHNIDAIIERPEEALSQNNSMYLALHTYAANDEIKNVFLATDGVEKSSLTGFSVQFIHRKELSRAFWGASLDYSSASSTSTKFGYWLLGPTIGYTPIRNKLFLIDLYGSFDLAINTQLEITSNFEKEPSGWLYGAQGNARIQLFPDAKYHLTGGVGLRKYKFIGLGPIQDSNGVYVNGITSLTAVQIFVGAGLEF